MFSSKKYKRKYSMYGGGFLMGVKKTIPDYP
jgi:hypothetical protein